MGLSEFSHGFVRGVPDTAHATRPIRAGMATGPVLSGRSPSPPTPRIRRAVREGPSALLRARLT